MNAAPEIYTVSQLNRETRHLLSEHFLTIKVEGEISNLSKPSSGHIYFSLKDMGAQIRCAMFRASRRRINFVPDNGKKVIVTAQVSLYEARGDYQLIVENMQESGDGALRLAYEALKLKLSDAGLFDQTAKKPVPEVPEKIAVITSPTGAAIKDILFVLKKRFPAIAVVIYPVAVQGDSAKYEIVQALTTANQRKECDVIILARGGGSLEDLWAFNEEIVAQAIYASVLPIVSGIGHEIDFTIADFVSDLRAPTPSVAAEIIAPDQQHWLRRFQQLETHLLQLLRNKLGQSGKSINWLLTRLQQQHPGKQLETKAQRLDDLELRLKQALRLKIRYAENSVSAQSARLWQHNPVNKINSLALQVQHLAGKLNLLMEHRLKNLGQQLAQSSQTLHAVSPLATLNRGYAMVTKQTDAEVIYSAEQISKGDLVNTRLSKGRFVSQIQDVYHDPKDLS